MPVCVHPGAEPRLCESGRLYDVPGGNGEYGADDSCWGAAGDPTGGYRYYPTERHYLLPHPGVRNMGKDRYPPCGGRSGIGAGRHPAGNQRRCQPGHGRLFCGQYQLCGKSDLAYGRWKRVGECIILVYKQNRLSWLYRFPLPAAGIADHARQRQQYPQGAGAGTGNGAAAVQALLGG